MKSYRIKRNADGKYFRVIFGAYNNLEKIEFVKNKRDATIIQPDLTLDAPNGKIKIGEMRAVQMSLFFSDNGISKKDYMIEKFLATEQSLIDKKQANEIIKEIKELRLKSRTDYQRKWERKNKKRRDKKRQKEYIEKHGYSVLESKRRKEGVKNDMVKDYIAGMSFHDIGKKYRRNHSHCRNIIKKLLGEKYKIHQKQIVRGERGEKINSLFKRLVALCKKLNRLPYEKEARKAGVSQWIYNQLKAKLIELGYKTINEHKRNVMLDNLEKLAIKLNKIPTATDITKSNIHASSYQYFFGTLKKAQQIIRNRLKDKKIYFR